MANNKHTSVVINGGEQHSVTPSAPAVVSALLGATPGRAVQFELVDGGTVLITPSAASTIAVKEIGELPALDPSALTT